MFDYSKLAFIVRVTEAAMKKSITSREYKVFIKQLADCRERAGLTQAKLAEALGETQSTISKIERAERRIDVIELLAICAAVGVPPVDFVKDLNEAISKGDDELR